MRVCVCFYVFLCVGVCVGVCACIMRACVFAGQETLYNHVRVAPNYPAHYGRPTICAGGGSIALYGG